MTPAVGSQVGLIQSEVATLAAHPPLCDLGPAMRATLINWPGIALGCRDVFLPVLRR
jgi:hypothetical protein